MSLWKVIFILSVVAVTSGDSILVNTPSGPIRGFQHTPLRATYRAFYGIPYAEVSSKLRFVPATELQPWTREFLATDNQFNRKKCYEKKLHPNSDLNCLTLSVYVPENGRRNANVVVFIPGGQFQSSRSSTEYDFLLQRFPNSIIVSINYRVFVEGFFTLGIPEAPGNVGLMDQQMALKWVQKNIASFGGNPNEITLYGREAGSASVGFHILAPGSRGLFKRAIMNDGFPNSPSAIKTQNEAINASLHLAAYMGCTFKEKRQIVECLRRIEPEIYSRWVPDPKFNEIFLAMGPTIDKKFLPKHPTDLLKENISNPVEVLIENNLDFEGYYNFLPRIGELTERQLRVLVDRYFYGTNIVFRNNLLNKLTAGVSNLYPGDILRQGLFDFLSDFVVYCPSQEFASYVSRNPNSRVYAFAFKYGDADLVRGMKNKLRWKKIENQHFSWLDNFSQTGSPSTDYVGMNLGEWPQFKRNNEDYLLVAVDKKDDDFFHLSFQKKFRADECNVLNKLIKNNV